jgi:hypothetical protein
MELCPDALLSKKKLRVHLRAFFKKELSNIAIRSASNLAFKSCSPFKSFFIQGQRIRQSGSWAAAYYVLSPKDSSIFTGGNKRAHHDFPVNGTWVMSLMSSKKMSAERARVEVTLCGSGLTRRLADLDKYVQECRSIDLSDHIAAKVARLEKQLKSFVRIPAVDEWVAKYSGDCFRKKFLVLEGPSGLGKTEFAKRILGNANDTFEINCAGGDHFDLRGFVPLRHRLILWDEASPSLVSKERRLFQCPPAWISLGNSATGCHSYKVWCNDCLMVVNSNKWTSELSLLPHGDAQWIIANQVLVAVTSSLVAE